MLQLHLTPPPRCLVQVYVQGELLGGCDIVLEMAEAGELKETIDEMKARL
jgi:glutaredoxin-related protein